MDEPRKPFPIPAALLTLLGGLLLTFAVHASSALSLLNGPRTLTFALAAVLFGLLADEVGRGKVLAAGVLLSALALGLVRGTGPGFLEEVGLLLLAIGPAMLLAPLLAILLSGVQTKRLLATVAGLYLAVGTVASFAARLSFQIGTLQVGQLVLQAGTFQLSLEAETLESPPGSLDLYLAGTALLGGLLLGLAFRLGRPAQGPGEPTGGGRWRRAVLLLAVAFLSGLPVALFLSFLPSYALERARVSPDVIRLLLMALPVPVLLAQFLAGPVADLFDWATFRMGGRRWGRVALLLLGALLLALGGGMLWSAADLAAMTEVIPIVGVGYGLLGPSLIARVAETIPRRWWGLAGGLYLAMAALGSSPALSLGEGMPASTAMTLAWGIGLLVPAIVLAGWLLQRKEEQDG